MRNVSQSEKELRKKYAMVKEENKSLFAGSEVRPIFFIRG